MSTERRLYYKKNMDRIYRITMYSFCIALFAFGLYYSHKKVYLAGWHRGGKVVLEYVVDSLENESNKIDSLRNSI